MLKYGYLARSTIANTETNSNPEKDNKDNHGRPLLRPQHEDTRNTQNYTTYTIWERITENIANVSKKKTQLTITYTVEIQWRPAPQTQ